MNNQNTIEQILRKIVIYRIMIMQVENNKKELDKKILKDIKELDINKLLKEIKNYDLQV